MSVPDFPADAPWRIAAEAGGGITDVAGLRVGHHTDARRPTGCTVVLADGGAVAGVDVRGAAPGTRETDLLDPGNAVEQVHAVLLAGGSAFGLAAATGVMDWLESRGIGLQVGAACVPIVPAAILFDLNVGDPRIRPDAASGRLACDAASAARPAEGSVGAGAGATVGKLWGLGRAMKGGIGTASLRVGGVTVGAIVAVNAVGDVLDPDDGRPIAGARSADGHRLMGTTAALVAGELPPALRPGMATTIGCVATDARLGKAECRRLAQCAHDGLARTIDPIHTAFDGDTMFALATGRTEARVHPVALGAAVAAVVAAAVLRAVRAAAPLSGPGLPDLPSAASFRAGGAR
jgi:L-aminopeptidase/D-esterase-like protein